MRNRFIAHQIQVTVALAIGLLACSSPPLNNEMPEVNGTFESHPINCMDRTESPNSALRSVSNLGRVWFNGDGEVIGFLFSTSRGDLIGSKDGAYARFIGMDRPNGRGVENPVGRRGFAQEFESPSSD